MTATLVRLHPEDDRARFLRLAGHIRVNGQSIVAMPPAITPEAAALRQAKERSAPQS